jgi:hypothetical protein
MTRRFSVNLSLTNANIDVSLYCVLSEMHCTAVISVCNGLNQHM